MAPRRKTTPSDTASTGTTKRRNAVTAGALLPVILGVASTQLPSGKGGLTTPPAPSQAAANQLTVNPQKGSFTPACDLPFAGAKTKADDICGLAGNGEDVADQQEAIAKNNFCAPTGHPQSVTYQQLVDLQNAAKSNDNPSGQPIGKSVDDRKDIENMGEGNYISYVALIMEAHYSDTSGGEKVNCNQNGPVLNDIHIVLLSNPDDKECSSTTAEMSPHYRPAGWTPAVLNALSVSKGSKTPVRIRGQLFFDNSHAVCGKTTPNPKRASLWEIHPVYSIDVCKSNNLDQCRKDIDDNTQWTPIT
jgi:hypothetical protein